MHSTDDPAGPAEAATLGLMRAAVEQASDAILITTAELDLPGPEIVYVNPAFVRMTGYAREDVIGRTPRMLQGPKTERAVLDRIRTACARGEVFQGRTYNYRKDGSEYLLDWQIAPILDAAGAVTHFVAIQQDVTAVVQLEAQYHQAQKMEAVGRLAGGIAHDFNNLLTVIGASARFLRDDGGRLAPDALAELEEIETAVRRAAGLTRQLLAFSRQQVRQPRALDLNDVVAGVERMLARVIGEDVRLATPLAPRPLPVLADPGQLEQVLLNLAVNARDAMPEGGALTIRTAAVPAGQLPAWRATGMPGDVAVALLTVGDTGTGMDGRTAQRAFEPFFTTKELGKGSGLGLATVHGIITQSGGVVWIDSRPGEGTTVSVALPLLARHATPAAPARAVAPPRGAGTVLLVEDDDTVRGLIRRMLVRGGYHVVEARSGRAARERWREHAGEHTREHAGERGGGIDLLVTDMVMPEEAGHDLLQHLRAERPSLPAVLLSGYAPDARVERALVSGGGTTLFLEKPFTSDALLEHVARALARM